MSTHRTVIEAGPRVIRRLCCSADGSATPGAELVAAALDGIDDPVALVGERPVSVASLWRTALRSLDCRQHKESMVIVHPSWWARSRVAVITAAARTLADDVVTRPRSWLLNRASPAATPPQTVVVEIADRVVVVSGAVVVAEPRNGEARRVAGAVARIVAGMTRGSAGAVLIDRPSAVGGAAALAAMIAGDVRTADSQVTVVEVDDARLLRLAAAAVPTDHKPAGPEPAGRVDRGGTRERGRTLALVAVPAVVLSAAIGGVAAVSRRGDPAVDAMPMTFLVEGRLALTVPAHWAVRRVIAGPGSARVEVTSPSDPEVVLHLTQSPVAGETLSGTADSLKHAIGEQPAGVFVDFNPSARSFGRPAVTYREARPEHDVRWTVLLDGPVRISVGCQSRPGDEDAVREVCERAVRSAHTLG